MSLKGKYALITGSSRGIGRGIALKLADQGVNVAVHYYQNEVAALDTLAQVRERGADDANSDDQRLSDVSRAILISSVLFSVPHVLNLFAGHAEARVVAQLIWAFLLGVVFACLRIAGRSIWPVAVLHGGMNAFVHVNRLGIEIQPSLLRAAALAFAPIPLCIYGAILLRKR